MQWQHKLIAAILIGLVLTFLILIGSVILTPDNVGAQQPLGPPPVTIAWVYEASEQPYPSLPYRAIFTWAFADEYDQVCLYRVSRQYYHTSLGFYDLPREVFIGCAAANDQFMLWGGSNTDHDYQPRSGDNFRADFTNPEKKASVLLRLPHRYGYYSIMPVILR